MVYELKSITCGTQESHKNTEWANPITNRNLFDVAEIKPYIDGHEKWVSFIVILLNLSDRDIGSLLEEIGDNDNIIAIFICDNPISNSTNNRRKVSYVSKSLLTCKTTRYAIHSYECEYQKLHETSEKDLAGILKQKSIDLKRWLATNDKVKACDVLIIPFNTTEANLRDYQQRVIEFCKELHPGCDLTVLTIDDILSDGSDPNISKNERDLIIKRNGVICLQAETLAPIRICLVGNEEGISNKWTELIIGMELNSNDPETSQYDKRCTFVENEPVTDRTRENLVRRYGGLWKKRKLIRLDTIQERDAPSFLIALDHSHSTRGNREMIANVELNRWAMNYHENSTQYSTEFRATGQAQDEPRKQDDDNTEEIINPTQGVHPAHVLH